MPILPNMGDRVNRQIGSNRIVRKDYAAGQGLTMESRPIRIAVTSAWARLVASSF